MTHTQKKVCKPFHVPKNIYLTIVNSMTWDKNLAWAYFFSFKGSKKFSFAGYIISFFCFFLCLSNHLEEFLVMQSIVVCIPRNHTLANNEAWKCQSSFLIKAHGKTFSLINWFVNQYVASLHIFLYKAWWPLENMNDVYIYIFRITLPAYKFIVVACCCLSKECTYIHYSITHSIN